MLVRLSGHLFRPLSSLLCHVHVCACPQAAPLRLVPNLDQVVAQLLHRVRRDTRLHAFWVVRDKEGLRGLDDDDAFSALHENTLSACCPIPVLHAPVLRDAWQCLYSDSSRLACHPSLPLIPSSPCPIIPGPEVLR